MKRTIVILPFLIGLMLLTIGCDQRAERWLDMAEACMETNPDSAYRCLSQMDVMEGLSDRQQARYALLRTQAMHKCRIPLGSDSLINVAVEYYANSSDRHRLALSLLYKGLVHKQQYQVEQAVEAFVASEQAFEGVDDNQYKALLFNHYGGLLMNQNMYEEALNSFKKSYEYDLSGDSLHYLVRSCCNVAWAYRLLEMPDSASVYYKIGLKYEDSIPDIDSQILKYNYASFLIENKQYSYAEKILLGSELQMSNSNYIYNVYSSLATLYYELQEYRKALDYGRKILAGNDSAIICGGTLHIYRIFKQMGQTDSALYYHNLYRQYHSDIVMRQKTAEVAAIPYRVKSERLAEENDALTGWRLWLTAGIIGVALVAGVIYVEVRRKHKDEQRQKDEELEKVNHTLGETSAHLGRVKGAMANQTSAMNRMKMAQDKVLASHKKEIEQLKTDVVKLKNDIKALQDANREKNRSEVGLKQELKELGRKLKMQTDKLEELEHEKEIDSRIEHFMKYGQSDIAVDLLLQLWRGEGWDSRFDIKPSEYLPLLMELLEQENPAMHERLANSGLERKKLTMCYLMALGLDDIGMMSRAACLAPNSVKAYRKECREALCAFNG